MAPRKCSNSQASDTEYMRRLRQDIAAAKRDTADVTLPTFCREWQTVFGNPTVVPRPIAIMPAAAQDAEACYYPTRVVEWTGFETDVERAFRDLSARIREANAGNDAVLPPAIAYKTMGESFMRHFKLRNEAETVRYEQRAVHEPINVIFASLGAEVKFRLLWESIPRQLGEAREEESQQRQQGVGSSEIVVAEAERHVKDSVVMFDGQPVAVVEVEASDTLTTALLQLVRLPIDMHDVQHCCAEENWQAGDERQRATAAVALVVIKAYDCMIRRRVRYAFVTSCVAQLFMHFDVDDPSTLYLYRRIPGYTGPTRTRQVKPIHNVVSTVPSFIFLAAEAPQLPRDWRPPADLRIWTTGMATFDALATPDSAVAVGAATEGPQSYVSGGSTLTGRKRKARTREERADKKPKSANE